MNIFDSSQEFKGTARTLEGHLHSRLLRVNHHTREDVNVEEDGNRVELVVLPLVQLQLRVVVQVVDLRLRVRVVA